MVPAMFLLSLNSCESSYEIMGGDYEATNGGWHELDFRIGFPGEGQWEQERFFLSRCLYDLLF